MGAREPFIAHGDNQVSSDNMKNSNGNSLDGRIKDASQAKRDQLERFKKAAQDPERLAAIAQKKAEAAVRETQRLAKAAELKKQQEEQARIKSEADARDAEAAAAKEAELIEERKNTADKIIDQDQATEAEKKAERDRRYQARRNRKK